MHSATTGPGPTHDETPISERRLVLLLASITFVNILDFMMVMPMGPDFAAGLGIPLSRLGIVGGAYTAAAAIASMVASTFLDRFDRRRALAVAMAGLVLATAVGGLARGFTSLVAARVLAGSFGGPASAIGLAILADRVPVARRGRAMGAVMGAFAVASVLGVPAGLELARLGGWRSPFFAVAGLGLIVTLAALRLMPPMRAHLERGRDRATAGSLRAPGLRPLREFLGDTRVHTSLLATALMFGGTFALIPHLASYLQYNLGYPRAGLGGLYLAGGLVSFAAMRVGGRWIDRSGSLPVTLVGSATMLATLALGFVWAPPPVPIVALFVALMLSNALRSVALNTLSSRVPAPLERARFMSTQSAVQHLAAAVGAAVSALVLTELPDHRLAGMPALASGSIVAAALLPVAIWRLDRRVRATAITAGAGGP